MPVERPALCLSFQAAAGAHYRGQCPMLITPSLLRVFGEGWWAREGSSSHDWRGVDGWKRREDVKKGLDGPHTIVLT